MRFVIKKWADVLRITSGKTQKGVLDPNGAYPIYGSGGIMGYANQYLCEAGTTIVGRKGTIDNPIFVNERFWNVDTAFGISPGEQLNSRYLYFFCRHFNFRQLDKSTTIPSLAKTDLLSIEMPVPPLSEQKRIVARIEELFSELDNGVETLEKTKQQLAVYRQSVLKAAFAVTDAPFRRLEELCFFITKGTTPKKAAMSSGAGEIPFIKVYNLTSDNSLDFSINPTFVNEETHKEYLGRSIVYPGDVLMNIVGPPMGKVSIVPDTYPEWNINQAIARFRCLHELYNKYLAYFLGYSDTIRKMTLKAKATAGQFNLTLEICRDIQIPVPPIEKQRQIVAEIGSRLSVCDSIEKAVNAGLQQSESMRQSILKKAFEGGL